MAVETMFEENLNIGGNFSLDEILEEKQDENGGDKFRQPLKKPSGYEMGESKKILKKIGNRLSPEEIKRKSELIIQISRFRDSSRFSNFLNSLGFNLNPTHLKTLDISELEDLIVELKSAIQNKNGSKVLDEAYFMVLGMCENISKHPKFKNYLDLNGLSQNARQSDELLDTLECLSLMYGDLGSLTPEKKLLFLTGGLILRTSSVNKMISNIQKYEQQLKEQVENPQNQPTRPTNVAHQTQQRSENTTFEISKNKDNITRPANVAQENNTGVVGHNNMAGVINFDTVQ